MYLIQQVTDYPNQQQSLVLPNSTNIVTFTLYFSASQIGWFITELRYLNFVLNGLRVTNSPNMLNQFRNQIPFGLACFSNANIEPAQQQAFSSGNSSLYILDQTEVQEYADFLSLGTIPA